MLAHGECVQFVVFVCVNALVNLRSTLNTLFFDDWLCSESEVSQLCADTALVCSIHKKMFAVLTQVLVGMFYFFALVYISWHWLVPDGFLGTVCDHTNSLTDI